MIAGPPSDPSGPGRAEPDPLAPDRPPTRPAFYAARRGGARDWWTLLHPPYTAWHLSYVVIGACLAPSVQISRLLATVLAFFAAVGIAAHALDELQGRPLNTSIPAPILVALTTVGLIGAVGLGIAGVFRVGWPLVPFLVIGPVLVLAYNLELFSGRLHSDAAFAASWGAFPVLAAYVAQTGRMALAPVLAAVAAYGLSIAQRRLSTPARLLRRRATRVDGEVHLRDGTSLALDQGTVLAPLEGALRTMSWSLVLLAAALAVARLT